MSNDVKQYAAQILKQYPNGATSISKNGVIIHICYNTGDEVWFDDAGNLRTIHTHDGLSIVVKE
jgi:hypothetical protein